MGARLEDKMESKDWLNRRPHRDGLCELQLGHGPNNRLTAEFLADFENEIRDLDADPDVRAILLTSPFTAFSIGIDPEQVQDVGSLAMPLSSAFLALYSCMTPVVVAALGPTSNAAMFFVLASDIRVSHARASFEMNEVVHGWQFPPALMEIARATLDSNTQRRLMLTGQRLGPIAARNAQFIEVIADDLDDLHGYAMKEAHKLAELPFEAFAAIKRELRRDTIARIEHLLDRDMQQAQGDASPDRGATDPSAAPGEGASATALSSGVGEVFSSRRRRA